MHYKHLILFLAFSLSFFSEVTSTQNKEKYNFYNPTPINKLREISADRPDFTESPYTVDAGKFQIEHSFFDYSQNSNTNTWSVLPFNFKVGLNNSIDLQLVFDPYLEQHNGSKKIDGTGDFQIRIKKNIWGNDLGDSAFGLMPFIKIPTSSDNLGNDHLEGGIIFPYSKKLSNTIGLGLMFETDFVYDENNDEYNADFILTSALGFDLGNSFGFYSEAIAIFSNNVDQDFSKSLGLGLTYSLKENIILDLGTNLRLLGSRDDFNVFSGYTIRY